MHNPFILKVARGRTRTGTGSPPGDFKSPVSTIPPLELRQEQAPLHQKKPKTTTHALEMTRGTLASCPLTTQESFHATLTSLF